MEDYLVSYADTDAGGVLHHAKYVELAESGRHWWLKKRGFSFSNLNHHYGVSLVVHKIFAKYRSAIFLEDQIAISTALRKIDRKGLEWSTKVIKNKKVSCSIIARMVCVDVTNKQLMSVPESLISLLKNDIEN